MPSSHTVMLLANDFLQILHFVHAAKVITGGSTIFFNSMTISDQTFDTCNDVKTIHKQCPLPKGIASATYVCSVYVN